MEHGAGDCSIEYRAQKDAVRSRNKDKEGFKETISRPRSLSVLASDSGGQAFLPLKSHAITGEMTLPCY